MKPLEDSLAFSARLAQEYGVEGVVYVYLKFCACYGITRSAFTDHFQELGIPVLELSSDYSLSDHGQLKTRVEAFVEILNERRDDRARAAPEATTHQVSQ
jgi:benzoyl-CoA reductase/2-hydroxyglutaryl-CoA dehydratase subunit BcrC/BadD/HgdB